MVSPNPHRSSSISVDNSSDETSFVHILVPGQLKSPQICDDPVGSDGVSETSDQVGEVVEERLHDGG